MGESEEGKSTPLLIARRVTLSRGGRRIIDGVDVTILPGEVLAIVGPSGSGKSTLLHLLGGMLVPDSGTLTADEVDLTSLGRTRLARWRRRNVGIVFQDYSLIPYLRVDENVGLSARLAKKDVRVAPVLDAVGLADKARAYPAELSGGERQRVAVARAIALGPPLLLADEPTASLDSANGRRVVDLLVGARSSARAVVIVTHDLGIASVADRALVLRDGKVVGEIAVPTPEALLEALTSAARG